MVMVMSDIEIELNIKNEEGESVTERTNWKGQEMAQILDSSFIPENTNNFCLLWSEYSESAKESRHAEGIMRSVCSMATRLSHPMDSLHLSDKKIG